MKYDEKALEAAVAGSFDQDNIGQLTPPEIIANAISAYCEKAGVVMVPIDPDEQKIALALHDIDDWRGPMREGKSVFREFARSYVRASQEEE